MFNFLQGKVVGIYKQNSPRVILVLNVNNIGYELQIVPRMVSQLPAVGEIVQVFTHLQVREDQLVLYGFFSLAERDLFRQLISVSGIGTQLAIALLDTLGLQDLVQAIVNENTRILIQTPGVGKKTAERITLELKTKLSQWRQKIGLLTTSTPGLTAEIQEDIEMTLLALGYTASEVMQVLKAITQEYPEKPEKTADEWIETAITWLTQNQSDPVF
ncbi:MAG: Holliday junction branch migration protein RuvA [Microcoleaceae cyanobacterium]